MINASKSTFFNEKSSCIHFRNNVRYVEYTEFAEQSYDLIFLILWSAIIVCVNINFVLTDMFITHYVSHSIKEWVSFFLRSLEMNLGEARDKSREPRSGSRKICHCLTQVHFPWMQKNKTLSPYIYNIFEQNTFF